MSPRALLDAARAWMENASSETLTYRIALVALVLLLVVQTSRLWWTQKAPRLRLARLKRRAIEGELEAETLLRASGFVIEQRQACAVLEYFVDGESTLVDVRADLLVRRDGKLYVAEVKTGTHATQLSNRATRRQLLEYAHAFDTEGVLLIDADTSRIAFVRVPERIRKPETSSFVGKVALVIGIAIALVLLIRMRG
jgi:hypothetical protein